MQSSRAFPPDSSPTSLYGASSSSGFSSTHPLYGHLDENRTPRTYGELIWNTMKAIAMTVFAPFSVIVHLKDGAAQAYGTTDVIDSYDYTTAEVGDDELETGYRYTSTRDSWLIITGRFLGPIALSDRDLLDNQYRDITIGFIIKSISLRLLGWGGYTHTGLRLLNLLTAATLLPALFQLASLAFHLLKNTLKLATEVLPLALWITFHEIYNAWSNVINLQPLSPIMRIIFLAGEAILYVGRLITSFPFSLNNYVEGHSKTYTLVYKFPKNYDFSHRFLFDFLKPLLSLAIWASMITPWASALSIGLSLVLLASLNEKWDPPTCCRIPKTRYHFYLCYFPEPHDGYDYLLSFAILVPATALWSSAINFGLSLTLPVVTPIIMPVLSSHGLMATITNPVSVMIALPITLSLMALKNYLLQTADQIEDNYRATKIINETASSTAKHVLCQKPILRPTLHASVEPTAPAANLLVAATNNAPINLSQNSAAMFTQTATVTATPAPVAQSNDTRATP